MAVASSSAPPLSLSVQILSLVLAVLGLFSLSTLLLTAALAEVHRHPVFLNFLCIWMIWSVFNAFRWGTLLPFYDKLILNFTLYTVVWLQLRCRPISKSIQVSLCTQLCETFFGLCEYACIGQSAFIKLPPEPRWLLWTLSYMSVFMDFCPRGGPIRLFPTAMVHDAGSVTRRWFSKVCYPALSCGEYYTIPTRGGLNWKYYP